MSTDAAASVILTCPACATRYRVAEHEFEGAAGRTVRCANCGHLWHETAGPQPLSDTGAPTTSPIQSLVAPPEERASPGAPVSTARLNMQSPRPGSLPQQYQRRPSLGSWVVAAVVLFAGVIFATCYLHDGSQGASHGSQVFSAPAAHPNSTVAEPATSPGNGLVIREVTPARTADGLVVQGEVANLTDAPRQVPRLRLVLQDSSAKEVASKTVDPPKPKLEPGEVAHFEAPFVNPPDAATGVVVTFVSP
ncbi:MAG: DUF3426 domain-containing protein [Stellaceae bacterium]